MIAKKEKRYHFGLVLAYLRVLISTGVSGSMV